MTTNMNFYLNFELKLEYRNISTLFELFVIYIHIVFSLFSINIDKNNLTASKSYLYKHLKFKL